MQDVSGEQKPQPRISALVSCLLQVAGTPRFHPAKTLGGSRAPSSRVWALGWAARVQTLPSPGHLSLGQDSCPPRASALSAVPWGHGGTLAELTCYRPWGAWWLQGRRRLQAEEGASSDLGGVVSAAGVARAWVPLPRAPVSTLPLWLLTAMSALSCR